MDPLHHWLIKATVWNKSTQSPAVRHHQVQLAGIRLSILGARQTKQQNGSEHQVIKAMNLCFSFIFLCLFQLMVAAGLQIQSALYEICKDALAPCYVGSS